jgi:heme-degrading monooxygenase HmoA
VPTARGKMPPVILEQVLLSVVPGREAEFEEAFDTARHIPAAATGFRSLRLGRCVEQPSTYLLLIEWDTLADHMEGFRNSPAFGQWRGLLGHFWDPPPSVLHFEDRVSTDGPR